MYPQKNWPTYKLAGSQKSHPHPPLNQNPTPWLETGPVDTCGKGYFQQFYGRLLADFVAKTQENSEILPKNVYF